MTATSTSQRVLGAANEGLRADARVPERLAHVTKGEAELPSAARLGIRGGRSALREKRAARGVRPEGDEGRCLEDGQRWLEIEL